MKASPWSRLGWAIGGWFKKDKSGWDDVIKSARKQKTYEQGYQAGKIDAEIEAEESYKKDTRVSPSVYVANAISWAADLHPNGHENSAYVKVIDYPGDASGTLRVTFRDGTTVEYTNVDYETAKAFMESDSKGRFVHNHLRNLKYKLIK